MDFFKTNHFFDQELTAATQVNRTEYGAQRVNAQSAHLLFDKVPKQFSGER